MTPFWKLTVAAAALVLAVSAGWLVIDLLGGGGLPVVPLIGLIAAAALLVVALPRWLSASGDFYEAAEDDEDTGRVAAPSAPVTRGWTGSHSASGGGAWTPSEWPREDDLSVDDVGQPDLAPRAAPDAPRPSLPAGLEESEPRPAAREQPPAPAPEPPAETPEAAALKFAAYYPREVKPDDWQPLRAYLYRAFAAEAVVADARAQFGARADIRATTRDALQPVPEDALVTAIPSLPGFEFDPPQASRRFRQDWRRFDFEFRAQTAPLDASADGRLTFLVEGVIVADVPLSVYVTPSAGQAALQPQESNAEPYQAIFCSYSHKDTAIVERVERASRYFNFRYLRDVTTLRSGETWNARLLELIDSADIFQLFWSRHAAASDYVRQEYQYAVALRRRGAKSTTFIRPIRWEEPMPAPPPPELSALHFDLIPELAEEI